MDSPPQKAKGIDPFDDGDGHRPPTTGAKKEGAQARGPGRLFRQLAQVRLVNVDEDLCSRRRVGSWMRLLSSRAFISTQWKDGREVRVRNLSLRQQAALDNV
jgi:hypothetical protein